MTADPGPPPRASLAVRPLDAEEVNHGRPFPCTGQFPFTSYLIGLARPDVQEYSSSASRLPVPRAFSPERAPRLPPALAFDDASPWPAAALSPASLVKRSLAESLDGPVIAPERPGTAPGAPPPRGERSGHKEENGGEASGDEGRDVHVLGAAAGTADPEGIVTPPRGASPDPRASMASAYRPFSGAGFRVLEPGEIRANSPSRPASSLRTSRVLMANLFALGLEPPSRPGSAAVYGSIPRMGSLEGGVDRPTTAPVRCPRPLLEYSRPVPVSTTWRGEPVTPQMLSTYHDAAEGADKKKKKGGAGNKKGGGKKEGGEGKKAKRGSTASAPKKK